MAKKRGRKNNRLDAVAVAAGSTLGSVANQLDALNRKRNEISAQIRSLVRRAESELKGIAAGENPFPVGKMKTGKKAKKAGTRKRKAKAKASK